MRIMINFEKQWIGVYNYEQATTDELNELNWLKNKGNFTIIKLP